MERSSAAGENKIPILKTSCEDSILHLQVNAWRPLYHPVYDCGLCVADAETLTDEDCIEAKRIRETDGGFLDTMGVVKYREGRQWYYKSQMESDDVVLFMGYDSDCARKNRDGPGCKYFSFSSGC